MTTIIENDPQVADLLRQAVPGSTSILTTTDELTQHLEKDPSVHAVVLGPSVPLERAVEIAESNRILRPALGIVLVRPTVDGGLLARAMRSGMREVVAVDDLTGLGHAVRRAQAVARAMSTNGERATAAEAPGALVTVFSTKGGVGKTLLATNLGAALADRGHRVCIVDLDVEAGDVAVMMSLTPQHTLGDLARINGELDAGAVESLVTRQSDRLSVLAAPVYLGVQVAPASVARMLELLKGMFDVVVVDTSGAFDDHSLQALDHSDLLVLVGTLDIPSVKNLKLAIGTLDLLNFPRDLWRLLVNRADPKIGLSIDEVEKTLGVSVAAAVPSSRDVLTAVNRGEPIVRANPGHEVSRKLAAFAAEISRDVALPGRPAPTTSRRAPRRVLRSRKVA